MEINIKPNYTYYLQSEICPICGKIVHISSHFNQRFCGCNAFSILCSALNVIEEQKKIIEFLQLEKSKKSVYGPLPKKNSLDTERRKGYAHDEFFVTEEYD